MFVCCATGKLSMRLWKLLGRKHMLAPLSCKPRDLASLVACVHEKSRQHEARCAHTDAVPACPSAKYCAHMR